ncbi:DUF1742-domain-containing protein [Lactarius psammicola]|nr:DUF1742-domain-containing protein [Lactarius psammicola]
MSFQNIYFKRATATSRACYVCSKPTTICLATTNAVDFIYTCDAHLADPGFATEIVDPNAPKEVVVSKEEIARVKAEWETKEEARKKKDNEAKAATGDKGGGAAEGGAGEKKSDDDDKKKSSDKSPSPSSPVPGSLPSPSAASKSGATPTHKRYSLHRDFYAMRQAEHRRRRQTKQMNELAPRLPGAPRGSLVG